MTNYFTACTTLDELKAEYRRLAIKYHPDLHPEMDEKIMLEINLEYERMHDRLQSSYNASAPADRQKHESSAEFVEILDKLLKMRGIEIELCGSWLWISGDTRANKDELKAAGCRWAAQKKLWYWHPADYTRHNRKTMSMEHIRTKYGSDILGSSKNELVSA